MLRGRPANGSCSAPPVKAAGRRILCTSTRPGLIGSDRHRGGIGMQNRTGRVGASRPVSHLTQVFLRADPLEGKERTRAVAQRRIGLKCQRLDQLWEERAKHLGQQFRMPHHRRQAVHAAALRAAQVTTRQYRGAIIGTASVMPWDVAVAEVGQQVGAERRIEILGRSPVRQAEFAPVVPCRCPATGRLARTGRA